MEVLTNQCKKITMEDKDETRLVLEQARGAGSHHNPKWCLVGRFLKDILIKTTAMKNTLMRCIMNHLNGMYHESS